MTKTYGNFTDFIDFSRSSGGTALRRVSYGSELVTNGTFDTDASGWTTSNCTVSVSGGVATLTASASGTAYITQTFAMAGSKVYVLNSSFSGGTFNLYDTGAFTGYLTSFVSGQSWSYYLSDADGNVSATYYWTASGAGDTITIDNVSIKEVTFDQPSGDLVLFNHPTNVPRVEYDANGVLKGLLIEEARTNLVTHSEDFTGYAETTMLGASASLRYIVEDALNSPDGTGNASKMVSSTDFDAQRIYKTVGTTVGLDYLGSCYMKAGEYRYGVLVYTSTGGAGLCIFDLESGTVHEDDQGIASIEDAGNGWYRCSVLKASTSQTYEVFQIGMSADGTDYGFTGDGTSGIYIWGAQVEAGSFPTSYIPTTGSTKTRSADIASIATSNFGYNKKAGTVVVEASIDRVSSVAGTEVVQLTAALNSTSDATRVFYRASGATGFFNSNGGSTDVDLSPTGVLSAGEVFSSAFSYKHNDYAVSGNGGSTLTDSVASVPSHAYLQIGDGQQALNGHIKSIKYLPRRNTNTQLQEFTS